MLVLSRKERESVIVGDDVRVTVVAISGNKVRLGFEAPSSVVIHREEFWLEIQTEAKGDIT